MATAGERKVRGRRVRAREEVGARVLCVREARRCGERVRSIATRREYMALLILDGQHTPDRRLVALKRV